jgi:hypothetical protein
MSASSWNVIAEAEVLQEFIPAEQAAIKAAAGAVDQLPSILTRTVNQARGLIEAAGAALGGAATIPDSLRPDVIAIARWRWLTSIPQFKSMQTAERKALYDDAIRHLDELAKRERTVESPTAGTFSAGGASGSDTKIVMRTTIT